MSEVTTTAAGSTLADLEAIIDRGKQTFVEVGNALTEIRERNLYREGGYPTFEDYCQRRHGFSRQRGYQLMAAAALSTTVVNTGGAPPVSEREARAVLAMVRNERRAVQNAERAESEAHRAHQYSAEGLASQPMEQREISERFKENVAAGYARRGALGSAGSFTEMVARIESGHATRTEIWDANAVMHEVIRACIAKQEGDAGAAAVGAIRKIFARWQAEANEGGWWTA